jgi:hypothetical protein
MTNDPTQLRKLQEIFLPYYTKRRKLLFGNDFEKPLARFVHYTSADTAIKIIRTKRLWMRNALCMADYREVKHGHAILSSFFKDPLKGGKFCAAIDGCIPGGAQQILNQFDQATNLITSGTYITSLSEHDDTENDIGRLSMWRAFGSDARVALVFDIPAISKGSVALNLMFSPVCYLPEADVHASLMQAVGNIDKERSFLQSLGQQTVVVYAHTLLLAAVTCLKHPGFHEEREWRAIHLPNLNASKIMDSSLETVAGVPQLVYKIPLDAKRDPVLSDLDLSRLLTRVVVGPTDYGPAVGASFVAELSQLGVPNADKRVVLSDIPLRA